MKKRLLSLVLCLVMVFSLLPMGSLAIERPGEGYVAITNPTEWTPLSDYNGTSYGGDTNEVYALYNGEYYPVQFETGTLYEDAGAGWYAHTVAAYGQDLYSKSGATYTKTSTTSETWYALVDSNIRIYGNFTYNTYSGANIFNIGIGYGGRSYAENNYAPSSPSHSNGDPYFYYKASDHTWHAVYSNSTGKAGYYAVSLYYYNDEMYSTLMAGGGAYTTSNNAWRNSANRAKITLLGDGLEAYSWAWGGEELTTFDGDTHYRGHDFYFQQGNPSHANKLLVGSTVLAWPNPGTQDSELYSGHLYKRLTNQKVKMYINVPDGNGGTTRVYPLTDGTARTAVETTDLLFRGTLYYHSNHAPLPSPTPTSIITTDETGDDGVFTHKDLTANGDAYDVTLTAYTTGNEVTESQTTITPTVNPMDIVMVIDQSGSMATRDMGDSYAADSRTSWTVEQATSGQTHYVKVGNNYYPVQADTGYLYEEMETAPRGSDMIGWGDDGITLGVNGAPTFYNIKTDYYVLYNGEMHRLYLITAGLFLNYGLYPYIYVDNNDGYAKANKWEGHNYWVAVFDPWDGSDLRDNSTWNTLATNNRIAYVESDDGSVLSSSDYHADRARLSYSWVTSSARINGLYKLSDRKAANQLYYVDSAGVRHNLGTQASFSDSVVYQNEQGPLYVGNSTSRLDALKDAVTQFANAVQQNALTNPEHPVDHRMAFVGFAGNKVPAYSLGSNAVTVGSNGLKDYTNTGLFNSGNLAFENYERITGYTSTSDNYINRHYYRNNGNTLLRYIDGAWYTVDLNNGAKDRSYSGSWSKAAYEGNGTSLSAADYRAALVSVNNNGALNSTIASTINQFAANGGTYTSYGMSMAEQLYQAVDAAGDTEATDSEGQPTDRQRVIIVFTDGEPGGNGYESSIAGEALAAGNKVQKGADGISGTEDDVLIYTVGLFKGTPSSQVSDFMKKLSSEYSMNLEPVYGGQDNANYSLGQLDPNKTYYYQNADTGKYYALTTEYGNGNSLGWWVYNGSRNGNTTSYSLTNAKTSTGAGTTVFYNANGGQVQGDNVRPGTTYYTANGDKIVYEYRWFDSDRSVINPMRSAGDNGSVGEGRVQFFELTSASANDDGFSYYMTAANQAELNNVFVQIADSIIQTETTVANNSRFTEDTLYVMDEISADFDLPANLSAENNHVTVYAEKPNGWIGEGDAAVPNWDGSTLTQLDQGDEAAITAGDADVKVTWEGKKLKVEYFDFGRMYMQQSNPNAARIRVVIDGITPNKAGEKLYSNTAQSGLYYKDPVSGAVTMVEDFNRPFISVPGYTVTWVSEDGDSEQYDQDTDLIKGSVPVYDGIEPTKDSVVVENVSRTDYTFDGWSTTPGGAKVIDITRDAESGVVTSYGTFPEVVNSNVTYYAHFASEVKNFYTATWFNGATELYQQPGLANGDVPEYGGAIPAKDADDTYTYFFAGWHKDSRLNDNDVIPANRMPARDDAEYNAKLAALLNELRVSAQPDAIDGADVNYYAVFAPVQIQTRNIIVEYSAKYLVKGGSVTDFDAMYTPGGEFTLEKVANADSGDFFFTANPKGNSQYFTSDAVIDTTGFSKVNTGVYYEGENKTQPTKVNIIPGASVYFDDDLLEAQAAPADNTAVGNYEGVSGAEIGIADYNAKDGSRQITFKFTGTGVDIYSTTLQTGGGYIVAMLKGNGVSKSMSTKNTAAENRVNVPSIFFRDLTYGTYTITLTILKGVDYQLDGMRVYGALASGEGEKNATFTNLRELLIDGVNMGKTIGFFSDTEATEEQQKTVYVKDLDAQGHVQYEEDGKTIKTKQVMFAPFTLDAYTIDGPKNEIYLDKGNAIAFTITNWDDVKNANPGIRLMAGISSPDSADASFSINSGVNQTASRIDQYYDVTPAEGTNTVMIANTSSAAGKLISVTNLKIVGGESEITATLVSEGALVLSAGDSAEAQELKIAVTEETLEYAAEFTGKRLLAENEAMIVEPDVPDTPDTPSTPSILDYLHQLISAFVQNLFKSVSRLFGN